MNDSEEPGITFNWVREFKVKEISKTDSVMKKIRYYFKHYKFDLLWNIIQLFSIFLVVVVFIWSFDFEKKDSELSNTIALYLDLFFVFDYCCQVIFKSQRWIYIRSVQGIIDFTISIPVLILALLPSQTDEVKAVLSILRIFRMNIFC
ncbi:hypothetical protein WA158_004397 [Blastocystis sp. Blastoise]